jgi:amidophosphoribosyltransferase
MEEPRDRFCDECGVFAVVGHPEASHLAYLGLHGLQHRGQESAGIVTAHEARIFAFRRLGLVGEIFSPQVLERLPGSSAIGHVRYSTAGGNHISNAQPLVIHYSRGSLAVAHNGNLTNALTLREELEGSGAIFQSTSDTEVLVHLVARSGADIVDAVSHALFRARGSYSILLMNQDLVIAARDPRGIRPLCLGRLGDAYVLSSESASFDLMGATFERDIQPGEILVLTHDGRALSLLPFPQRPHKLCLFEYVYFARPDSVLDGVSVYHARKRMGQLLAREHPVDADLVIPIPDSGTGAAIGFAEQSGLPFEMGLIRSHYVGRTFIEPKQSIRNFGVSLKLSACRAVLEGRKVVIVDDSLVRGTTARKIVENLRRAGAKEVHLRLASPPVKHSCRFGIDTPTDAELIANQFTIEQLSEHLGVDSLGYLSLDGLLSAVGGHRFCTACFSGDYPVEFQDEGKKLRLRFEGL